MFRVSLTSPPAPAPAPAPDFSGLWIPLVTPFDGGAVDHAALARLTAHLAATGIRGFVVCGSTGGAAALSKQEQLACLRTVAAHAAGLPLLMGASGYHLPDTRDWVRRLGAPDLPALAGLLVAPPHYVRPAQQGIRHWFTDLADASAAPLVVYDIPYRTGAVMTRETLLALAAHPNIRAVKDCGGDAGKTLALIRDGRLQVLAGEDLQIFSTVAQGGAGAIAASGHVQTRRFVALLAALASGNLDQARAAWLPLVALVEALFAEPNPGPLKALLAAQGWCKGELRLPMTAAADDVVQRLLAASDAAAKA